MLSSLSINQLRNFESLELPLAPGVTVFTGANGAGKTTILDAVHIISTGRPFSTTSIKSVIQSTKEECTVVGEVRKGDATKLIGVSRNRRGAGQAKIAGTHVKSLSELAIELPCVLLTSNVLSALWEGPEARRKVVDQLMFHVEQQRFVSHANNYARAIKQRNAALRHGILEASDSWLEAIIESGEAVTAMRGEGVQALAVELRSLLDEMNVFLPDWQLTFQQGWSADKGLEQALASVKDKDVQRGFTSVGPHRADLVVSTVHGLASDAFSRGQMKVFMAALKLAQGRLQCRQSDTSPIFLVDDVAAELDDTHAEAVFRVLDEGQQQVLATMVDTHQLRRASLKSLSGVFHVEHSGSATLIAANQRG